jgi:hypothetical protein
MQFERLQNDDTKNMLKNLINLKQKDQNIYLNVPWISWLILCMRKKLKENNHNMYLSLNY